MLASDMMRAVWDDEELRRTMLSTSNIGEEKLFYI